MKNGKSFKRKAILGKVVVMVVILLVATMAVFSSNSQFLPYATLDSSGNTES